MPHETDQYQKNALIFDYINTLYRQYEETLQNESMKMAKNAVRNKILISLSKLFYLDEEEKNINNDKSVVNVTQKKNADYSLEIIEKIDESLRLFPKSKAAANGGLFSRYVYKNISDMLKTLKEGDSLKEKNGSMNISAQRIRNAKKVKKLDAYYKKLGVDDENARICKIAASLNMAEKYVTSCLWLLDNEVKELDAPVKERDGDEKSASDRFTVGKISDPETLYFQKFAWQEYLELIQETWEETDSDSLISTLITISLLKSFSTKKETEDDTCDIPLERTERPLEAMIFDPRPLFNELSFMDKSILTPFFNEANYRLPQYQTVMEKVGQTKSSASQKVSRFYKKVTEKFYERYEDEKDIYRNLFPEKTLKSLVNFLSD